MATEDVLAYLRLPTRMIDQLVGSGELRAIQIGRQWRFRRSDLDEWLNRRRSTVRA